jgi:hypothetical protein
LEAADAETEELLGGAERDRATIRALTEELGKKEVEAQASAAAAAKAHALLVSLREHFVQTISNQCSAMASLDTHMTSITGGGGEVPPSGPPAKKRRAKRVWLV